MEWASGNVFIRPNELPKTGDMVQGHKHNFDHTTIVFKGGVHIKATLSDGSLIDRAFYAPDFCLIKAEVEHEITALVDDTVFWCVYAHREPQGDIVQNVTGWYEAYQ